MLREVESGFRRFVTHSIRVKHNLEENMAGKTCKHNSLSCILQIVNAFYERRFSSEGVGSLEDHEHELELSDRSTRGSTRPVAFIVEKLGYFDNCPL